jgi:cytochrome c oxidase cbb3-type subunit 3
MSPVLTTLTPETIADIATWVHYQIAVASERQNYQPLDVLAGSDAKKGEAYFSSHCASCHAVNGDFKAIGAKYASSPMNLQNAIVSGGGGGRGGRRGRGAAATPTKRVTVTLPSGEMISGRLRSIDAFLVSVDLDNGRTRSFFRNGNTPTVVVTDPMQGHLDLMSQYTDDDLHNLTAYLATLK